MAKARADGAWVIVITPLAVAAPYWNKLLHASVAQNEACYLPSAPTLLENWLSPPLTSPHSPHAAQPTRAHRAAGWRPAPVGAAFSAPQQTKWSAHESTLISSQLACPYAKLTSSLLLLLLNHEDKEQWPLFISLWYCAERLHLPYSAWVTPDLQWMAYL